MDITKIDENFKLQKELNKSDLKLYSVFQPPFEIFGVFYEKGMFRRIGEELAKSVNDGVYCMHNCTAGGRIRFKTDSPYVAVSVKLENVGKMPHFAFSGSVGMDLYASDSTETQWYRGTFIPPLDVENDFQSVVELGSGKMRDITINMPTYSGVSEIYIGLEEKAKVEKATPYESIKPIVYYGSSITQGGCPSRPGNAYESIISRKYNCDYINLGFSGSARGEKEISDYIKKLQMSIFVYDYDYNAPTTDHLRNTHERMFKEIREAQKDLPIIIMSRPKFTLNDEEKERLQIIKKTYDNARNSGDNNVYFLSGPELMATAGDDGTVDNCHPNDFGFHSMANALSPIMRILIGKIKQAT